MKSDRSPFRLLSAISVLIMPVAAPPSEAQQPPAAPASGVRYIPHHEAPPKVPKEVMWGPGKDIQAGIALTWRYGAPDQNTGLYVFGIYIRNQSGKTVTVTCPSFEGLSAPWDQTDYTTLIQTRDIFCTPHIQNPRGKKIDIAYKLGKEKHTFNLAPGEAVEVSHWMLRTMSRKGERGKDFTQVIYVDPGKYRLTCDLEATMGLNKRVSLRTAETTFEVTPDDLVH